MNYQTILDEICNEVKSLPDDGQVAAYIPELAKISPDQFGVHLSTIQGQGIGTGDFDTKFSIQSISKVLSLTLAFQQMGDDIWKRVGVEPSGNPFNSLWQLEYEQGKPRNPLINSGAIVICDMLCSLYPDPKQVLIDFVNTLCGQQEIQYNSIVALSEKGLGFRNAALINMMKASRNIENDIDQVLDLYYHQCSIEMTCREMTSTFLFLANHGKLVTDQSQVISSSMTKRINAIMQTCGFYDEAGEFTFKVGLPGKSGIGGGIVAIHPGQYAVVVWSPRLNKKGNSVKGMKFLEMLTTRTGSSIF